MTHRPGRTRILYVVSQPVRWVAFEWLAGGLSRDRFELSFLLLAAGPPPLKPYLEQRGVEAHHIPCAGRPDVLRVARTIARYCRDRNVHLVHAHFMDACLGGLLGARWAGVPLRLHTRHHAGPYPISHR